MGDPPACCDMHNEHCEAPADLCCSGCGEAGHPFHPAGVPCTWASDADLAVAQAVARLAGRQLPSAGGLGRQSTPLPGREGLEPEPPAPAPELPAWFCGDQLTLPAPLADRTVLTVRTDFDRATGAATRTVLTVRTDLDPAAAVVTRTVLACVQQPGHYPHTEHRSGTEPQLCWRYHPGRPREVKVWIKHSERW